MKAKRRHELQTNALADWLGRQIEVGSKFGAKVADPVRTYRKTLLGVLIGLVVAGIAVLYVTGAFSKLYSAVAGGSGGKDWNEYFAAVNDAMLRGDSEALSEVVKRRGDSVAGLWAAQSAGDIELAEGARLLYREREQAESSLQRAKAHFETVLQGASGHPLLENRARFGLAQTHECLTVAATGTKRDVKDHLERAAAEYGALAKNAQDAVVGRAAEQHLRQLERLEKNGFYEWLAVSKPPERTPPTGKDSGEASLNLDQPSETPQFTVPPVTVPPVVLCRQLLCRQQTTRRRSSPRPPPNRRRRARRRGRLTAKPKRKKRPRPGRPKKASCLSSRPPPRPIALRINPSRLVERGPKRLSHKVRRVSSGPCQRPVAT